MGYDNIHEQPLPYIHEKNIYDNIHEKNIYDNIHFNIYVS